MHAAMNAALVPKQVIPLSAARSHNVPSDRVPRIAVEQDDRRVAQQHPHDEVPHHPAGRGEPEHPVAGLRVEVQPRLLQVLEQDPALPVDDRLRQPGGSGGIQDPQRVVERKLRELELRVLRSQEPVLPPRPVQVTEPHDAIKRRDLGRDTRNRVPPIEVLTAVPVAIHSQQHLGLDLRETIDHAPHPEFGGGRGPHGADRGAREQRRDRLGDVRHVRGDPVAFAHARRPQSRGDRSRQRLQLAPGDRSQLPGLRSMLDRERRRVLAGEHVLDVAQTASPGTTLPRASPGFRTRAAAARQTERPGTRSASSRNPRGRSPTSATGRGSSRKPGRASRPATPGSASASCARSTPARASRGAWARLPPLREYPVVALGAHARRQQTERAVPCRRARRDRPARPRVPRRTSWRPLERAPGGAHLAPALRVNSL